MSPGQKIAAKEDDMQEVPGGFQGKARDREGVVHDEHWTTSREVAEAIVKGLRGDPLVADAWIEPGAGS